MSLKQLKLIASSIGHAFLKQINATNIQPSSARSLRFDIPTSKHGINRVKITEMGGTVNIQFLQITEVDVVAGVLPENIEAVITAFTKLEGESIPMTNIDAVLAAFKKPE